MSRFKVSTASFAVALGLLGLVSPADAAFTLEINDGVGPLIVINDGGVGDLSGGVDGVILISEASVGGVDNFNLLGNLAFSNSPGGALAILSDSPNLLRDGAGLATIEFLLTATGYLSPVSANNLLSQLTINASVNTNPALDSATFQSWADPANMPKGMTETTGSQTLPLVAALPNVATPEGFNAVGPYSLTNKLSVTMSNNGSVVLVTGLTQATPVPEPGTLALLTMGGVGLAGARWRRRKAT